MEDGFSADMLLDGFYRVNETTVTVSLSLKDIEGRELKTSKIEISKLFISQQLKNNAAEKLSDLADKATELGDSFVKISTWRIASMVVVCIREREISLLFAATT